MVTLSDNQEAVCHYGGMNRLAQPVDSSYVWGFLVVASAAILAAVMSVQVGVYVLLFALLAWWTWHYPEEAFWLLIVAVPILPMLKITQTLGTLTLMKDVIIGVLFVRQVLIPLVRKELPYRQLALLAPVVALAGWSVFSLLQANSLILGVLRLRDIGLYMMLYFAVLYLPHSRELMKRRLQWLGLVAAVVLALGIWQWFAAQDSAVLRFDPVRNVWIPRLSSVMAHPSIFGQYLVFLASGLGAWVLLARIVKYRLWALAGLGVVSVFVFLTYSRAVWIGLVAALLSVGVAWLWNEAKKRLQRRQVVRTVTAGVLLSVLGFLLALLYSPAGPYIRSAIDPTYGSNEERIEFFVRLVSSVDSVRAVIGGGLGDVLEQNFRVVDLEAYDIVSGQSRAVQLTKNRTLVDNQYLKTFIEMGVVGLVFYGWLYWRLAAAGVRQVGHEDFVNKLLGLWTIGFLASFVVQALFIDIWDVFPTNAIFWVMGALVSASAVNTARTANRGEQSEVGS